MLEINVKKRLGRLELKADLIIPEQGVTAVFGLSGAGKSSLINLVAGLSTPDQGRIRLNQRILVDTQQKINLPPEKRHIGYVFQDARLFPHYSVKKNLLYGGKLVNQAEFEHLICLLGISHLLQRYPNTLSGGEKQRVAIGRALLTSPEVLLMDEPLAALDLPRKRELMDYLKKLTAQLKIPVLYVSHSLEELLQLAERVILIEQGKIVAYEPLEVLWQSSVFQPWRTLEQEKYAVFSLPVRAYYQEYNITALQLGNQQLWISGQVIKNQQEKVRISINSSDVSLSLVRPKQSSIRNLLVGVVQQIIVKLDQVEVELSLDGGFVLYSSISRWSLDELGLSVGQSVFAQIKTIAVKK
ncbi:molybdenum ABC transporter ATP-binding protein [Mergibacter septicus]|uniref:molybdenum ABC transporter ATP-binding protein ModC n=1 Tax=Mergibacter septicus TaxID=221402 RepID=UPI001C789691|nr:molybdenum ABC transporter ATP-binding protein ModC [Mergibacter septicus]QDJ13043.1 molybdenum ABC transporter ATP-binding protein [Mergibacter septicus]